MPPQQESSSLLEGTEDEMALEILYEGHFYDVTNWIKHHPGGNIIKFYTARGEDATLAVQQFHNRCLDRTLGIMKGLSKRKVSFPDELGRSSETLKRHQALTDDFIALERELKAKGFFQPSLTHNLYRLVELAALEIIGLWCLCYSHVGLRILGIVLTAMFGGRCGWYMHEGGHHSITGKPRIDRLIQSIVYGIGDGMSGRWWSSQHNRHHAMPQRLHHDVDLETLPILAFNRKIMSSSSRHKGTRAPNFFLRHQFKLFVLVDTFLITIFWKLYFHPRYAWRKGAYFELFFMALHYYIALQFGVVNYILAVWLTSIYIFLNFALSHTHMPVTSEGLHWVEYSLLHTTDIQPSWWVDWWMCYLNYQIEHHLFPCLPQFRHYLVRPRIEALARKHNLPFHSITYWKALQTTFKNLEQVSNQLQEYKDKEE